MSGEGRERLRCWAGMLLDERSSPGDRLAAVTDLHRELLAVAGLAPEPAPDDPARTETRLAVGTAISPLDAARCVVDMARTTRFLTGVERAVARALRARPGAPVEVVYAGCGPLAPLALPLTTLYDAGQLRLTLVDVHAHSVAAVARVVDHVGAGEHVAAIVHGDAATWGAEPGRRPDVIVVECLQRALDREPQVALVGHLAPQLGDGGVLIPERIAVGLTLLDPGREQVPLVDGGGEPPARVRRDLGPICELTATSAAEVLATDVRVAIPADADRGHHLALLTGITVIEDLGLGDYDSGLTCPKILGPAEPGRTLRFRYASGAEPGLRWSWE